jgi:hypothetical protein
MLRAGTAWEAGAAASGRGCRQGLLGRRAVGFQEKGWIYIDRLAILGRRISRSTPPVGHGCGGGGALEVGPGAERPGRVVVWLGGGARVFAARRTSRTAKSFRLYVLSIGRTIMFFCRALAHGRQFFYIVVTFTKIIR